MNILLTGAFGNIGQNALEELAAQGHTVRCFDLETRVNREAAARHQKRLGGRMSVMWGDLRKPQDVAAAVAGQDVVVHLAFIIPKLSATGVESEDRPDWAREINVGGTRNLITAMLAQPAPLRILFASSYHVYGRTQDQPPPRTAYDAVHPVEHYAQHKVECEQMVRTSGLEWAIYRFAAALPIALKLDPGMFDVPLDNRMEFVHSRDVARAIANGVSSPDNAHGPNADHNRNCHGNLVVAQRCNSVQTSYYKISSAHDRKKKPSCKILISTIVPEIQQ